MKNSKTRGLGWRVVSAIATVVVAASMSNAHAMQKVSDADLVTQKGGAGYHTGDCSVAGPDYCGYTVDNICHGCIGDNCGIPGFDANGNDHLIYYKDSQTTYYLCSGAATTQAAATCRRGPANISVITRTLYVDDQCQNPDGANAANTLCSKPNCTAGAAGTL